MPITWYEEDSSVFVANDVPTIWRSGIYFHKVYNV